MRRTKIVCTIGPITCSYEQIHALAEAGMNVARINMSHGERSWHQKVIKAIRTVNEKHHSNIAIMLDTKGPEIRSGDLKESIHLKKGDFFTFTIRREAEYEENCTEVNYDGFIDDVQVGDIITVDSGMIDLEVTEKNGPDIQCIAHNSGTLTSRRHLNIKGKSAKMPSITEKDWDDINFGIEQNVDFIALSFVKNAHVIDELKKHIEKKQVGMEVIAKIESADSIPNLESILDASDGAMVARGDLGAEVPLEDVPLLQEEIVQMCRDRGKPVIVATHMLESMIVHPTPTRAEVTDVTQAVKQGADATMLSGETAAGKHPLRSIEVMNRVICRIEESMQSKLHENIPASDNPKMEIARCASSMASNLDIAAMVVFTRRGQSGALISQCRPQAPIFAFTNMSNVRRKLNLHWGITPYRIEFSSQPEKTIQRAMNHLKEHGHVKEGDRVIIISDILAEQRRVETIQIRPVD